MHAMMQTTGAVAPLVIRLMLAVVIWPHGAQKLLGWFGGGGLNETFKRFRSAWNISPWLALIAVASEFLGAMGLVVGLLTRVAALGIGITMTVAMLKAQVRFGFFMNWFGNKQGEGVEYSLLVIAMAISLIISGAGALSLDRLIAG
jgi:putative oxidoreductase